MTTATAQKLNLTLRRRVAAPRERVYAAWTEPKHLNHWWGSEGYKTTIAEVDLRVGGKYRLGMQPPDSTENHIVGGVFTEIDPPKRLAYSWEWEGNESFTKGMAVTVEFMAVGNETEIVLTHTGFSDDKERGMHDHGWNGVIDHLVTYLAAGK